LDFNIFDMNIEIQLPYLHSSLDTLFHEDSSVYGHCLLRDHFFENLVNYILAYEEGKSKRPYETSACILVFKKDEIKNKK